MKGLIVDAVEYRAFIFHRRYSRMAEFYVGK